MANTVTNRFSVIKALGQRVEQEHTVHLRDVRRIEQQSASFANHLASGTAFELNGNGNGEVDFESLVKGQTGTPNPLAHVTADPWDMDGWANSDADTALVSRNAFRKIRQLTFSRTPSPLWV